MQKKPIYDKDLFVSNAQAYYQKYIETMSEQQKRIFFAMLNLAVEVFVMSPQNGLVVEKAKLGQMMVDLDRAAEVSEMSSRNLRRLIKEPPMKECFSVKKGNRGCLPCVTWARFAAWSKNSLLADRQPISPEAPKLSHNVIW